MNHRKDTPMMTAWAATAYGGPEVLTRIERPVPVPRPDEILVRIEATTVSSGDRRLRSMDMPRGMRLIGRLIFGLTRLRQPVLGAELTGIVTAVGANVRRFVPGDAVIAMTGGRGGAHADMIVLKESGPVVRRPDDMPVAIAAALCFGGTTALSFLDRAKIAHGESLLVIGASGTVGSAIVQIGKARGAAVTAVTGPANLDLARSLGAATVIDYTQGPIAGTYDVIAETVGQSAFKDMIDRLEPGGRFLAIAGGVGDMLARKKDGRRCIAGPASETIAALDTLVGLWQAGLFTPLIEAEMPFAALPEAHRRADSGRKRGSLVIRLP